MFAKDLTGGVSHCCIEGVGQRFHVYAVSVQIGERCKCPSYHWVEGFCYFGVLQHLKVKFYPGVAGFIDPLQMYIEGHHDELIVASKVGSRKAPCLSNGHTGPEALPYHDVVYLVVVLSVLNINENKNTELQIIRRSGLESRPVSLQPKCIQVSNDVVYYILGQERYTASQHDTSCDTAISIR